MIKVGLIIMFYHISYVTLSVADKEAEGPPTLSLATFPKSANVSSKSTNLPTVAVNQRQEHAIILSRDQPLTMVLSIHAVSL